MSLVACVLGLLVVTTWRTGRWNLQSVRGAGYEAAAVGITRYLVVWFLRRQSSVGV